jgi:hypothetical protein
MNAMHRFALAALAITSALAPELVRGNAFDSFGGVQGRDLITMNVIPAARRWTNNAFTWEYNAAGEPAVFGGLTNAQVRTPMNNWATPINITLAANPGAAGTQDIRVSWANLGGGPGATLASTGATFGGAQINFSTITLNNNAAINWSLTGFQDVLQHEFGHSLGLVDSYNNNANTVVDFYDHVGGGDTHAGLAKGNNDNVMLGTGPANADAVKPFDNDDVHGAGWLYGTNNLNTIATAAWNLALGTDNGLDGNPGGGDDYVNYYQVANHHGSDDPAPHNWLYKGTIGAPSVGQTLIEIPARKVTGWSYAIGGGGGGWTANYNGTRFQLLGPGGFTGNYDIVLVSDYATEGLVSPTINGTLYDDQPTRIGWQDHPMIWAPVPEPSSMALLALAALGAAAQRQRTRRW